MFKFPYTNLHELNLDWILEKVKHFAELIPPMETAVEDIQSLQGDVEQAVEDANQALEDANQALETAEEAKEIAKQAAQGTIADGAVTTAKIDDEAVTTVKIADNAVTGAKIASGTIQSGNLSPGCVTTTEILDGTISPDDLGTECVTNSKLGSNAVTTAKINDGSVTNAKIADGAVTNAKIADGAVTRVKMSSDVFDEMIEFDGDHGSIYNPWTAPFSGIAIAQATWNTSGANGFWYIDDTTSNKRVCSLSTFNANGLSTSTVFPIIKGHTYNGTLHVASVSDVSLLCYRFK